MLYRALPQQVRSKNDREKWGTLNCYSLVSLRLLLGVLSGLC